jgi:hypothetical protein
MRILLEKDEDVQPFVVLKSGRDPTPRVRSVREQTSASVVPCRKWS